MLVLIFLVIQILIISAHVLFFPTVLWEQRDLENQINSKVKKSVIWAEGLFSAGVAAALGWNFWNLIVSITVNRLYLQALWSEPEFGWTYIWYKLQ